ncbi:hypothetical protein RN001_015315 [Aquatica leii]|uniref:Uncharacterized protein n=1 Tax=Aquatica leii TaxID=1421715 RepID=A0AAN7S6L6_9COLE|nr:hypothetical protein RN001_015315 [Aquatica leii]
MKLIVVILVVVSGSYAQTMSPSAEKWFEDKVHPFLSKCICASGADEAVVLEWLNSQKFPNNACLKCFIKCILISSDLIYGDGTVNYLTRRSPEISIVRIKSCDNQTVYETDLCQRAYDIDKCIRM